MTTLGFIGLGNMGAPMCANLVDAGFAVTCFDKNPAALDSAAAAGATAASCSEEVANTSDVLMTSLPMPDHVEAVMRADGALESLRPGSVWVDLTTNRSDLLHQLAGEAPAGVQVVDCPVTGAVDGARNANLTLFLGGDLGPVAKVRPILNHLGTVIECGVLGSGNVVKLVTNQLWFIHAAAIGEGFALGQANGVGLDVLWRAIKHSVGDSFVAQHDAPSIFAGHYDPSFSLGLCKKDLGLIAELSQQVGTNLVMTEAATAVFDDAAQTYGLDAGELHVAKRLEDQADLNFRLAGEWVPHWEK